MPAMILRYKISLLGKPVGDQPAKVLKGFSRIYEVRDTTTLYSLHKHLRFDLDFPLDQTVLFKAVDPEGNALARYSVIDLGAGTIDRVTFGQCHKQGQDSFVYFYDTVNRKFVLIDFLEEGSLRADVDEYPALVEEKGPNPVEFENGYVAFEDLPPKEQLTPEEAGWGDDDDDDDDDDDKEEEELIADEGEDE